MLQKIKSFYSSKIPEKNKLPVSTNVLSSKNVFKW